MSQFTRVSIKDLHNWVLRNEPNHVVVSLEALSSPDHQDTAIELLEDLGRKTLESSTTELITSSKRQLNELLDQLKETQTIATQLDYYYPEAQKPYEDLNRRLEGFKDHLQANGVELHGLVTNTQEILDHSSDLLTDVISQFSVLVSSTDEVLKPGSAWTFDLHDPKPERSVSRFNETQYRFFPSLTPSRMGWVIDCDAPEANGFRLGLPNDDVTDLRFESQDWYRFLNELTSDELRTRIEDLFRFNIESVEEMLELIETLSLSLNERLPVDPSVFLGFKQALSTCLMYYIRSQSQLNKAIYHYITVLSVVVTEAQEIKDA